MATDTTMAAKNSAKWANFTLKRTDAGGFLAQTQMGWFGLFESRTEGMSATELVERDL